MLDKIFQHRILTHILYWLSILLAYPIYAKGFGAPLYESFIVKLCFLHGQILATYILIYGQIPYLIYRKRYGLFALSLLVSFWVFPVIAHLTDDYLVSLFLKREQHTQHSIVEIISTPVLAYYQITAFLFPFVTAAVKSVKKSFEEQQELEVLEREKAGAELQFLKAQIHPHFLFKTLDHLYNLSLEKSDLAPEVVVKLSEMLDYMLYKGQDQKVSLSQETDLLQHYMDLQVLQYGDQLSYQIKKEFKTATAEIPPLLLLSLLESVLKNVETNLNKEIKILLWVQADINHVHFQLSISPIFHQEEDMDDFLWQLKLGYPDKHTFTISQKEDLKHFDLFLYN